MKFKIVPRSAVYGAAPEAGMPGTAGPWPKSPNWPTVEPDRLRAGRGATVDYNATPHDHRVAMMNGEIVRLRKANQMLAQQNKAIVARANAQLGAMARQIQHLSGLPPRGQPVRTAYSPQTQTPGKQPVDVGVPTHTLRNPYVEYVEGAHGAPPAAEQHEHTGNPRDAAGNPHDRAHAAHETVRAAEDAIFYGDGESAFYSGEGD